MTTSKLTQVGQENIRSIEKHFVYSLCPAIVDHFHDNALSRDLYFKLSNAHNIDFLPPLFDASYSLLQIDYHEKR